MAHKTLPFPQAFPLLSVRRWHLYSHSIQNKAPPPHFILGRRSSKNNKQLSVAVGFGKDSSSQLKDRPSYSLMNNSIYRRPFTPRCSTNHKHTLPHHRTGETANFKVSAGKIPQPAQCRETAKGKAVLHTGLLLHWRYVQAAKETTASPFSSLEIICMVFKCPCLNNSTPSVPKLKPSVFYCVSTCL